MLVEAFAQLADEFPDWTVELWGGGDESGEPYAEELRREIRSFHLEERVFLKGESRHIIDEYVGADIFCFPSAYEGFPLAMTEAMSAGLPVVVFRSCTAAAELVQDGKTGILAEDGADGLAEGLRALMQDQDRRAVMGASAREAMREYRPERIWDMWEELMEQQIKK